MPLFINPIGAKLNKIMLTVADNAQVARFNRNVLVKKNWKSECAKYQIRCKEVKPAFIVTNLPAKWSSYLRIADPEELAVVMFPAESHGARMLELHNLT
jgi:hypothetical protein